MKILSRHFPQIGLEQLLQWATLNAARFFGWDHLGSFEKGKRPGVNLITGVTAGRLGEDVRVRSLVPAGAGPERIQRAHLNECMKKHLNIKITGKVQGDWFLDSNKAEANQLGISGFVQHEDDGPVYAEQKGLVRKTK